jgi:phosphatidylinositol-3-phosphatase
MERAAGARRFLCLGGVLLGLAAVVGLGCANRWPPPTPRYDHIVIVVEENHSASQVMASPYLSSLAARGASFSRMYGVIHPSEPNYFVLFSGSTQGVTDDNQYDLAAPNLALSLAAAGLTFGSYSEDLPAVGDRVFTAGRYVRRHNPCASFANVPGSANMPFSYFPSDYSRLPTLSFVIPNLDNDMHDGSVLAGDAWLQAHLDGYARWAVGHNSLLIVTFDECWGPDPPDTTPIATVFAGASLLPLPYGTPATLYSLVRMIDEMYGLPTLGSEASAPRIEGIWQ